MPDEKTSPSVAEKASRILNDPTASADEKSVAASALTQAAAKDTKRPGADFKPSYEKDRDGLWTGKVKHTSARVRPRTELPEDATAEARDLFDAANKLRGETVEIKGQTSDGRRLCATKSGSAWLHIDDLAEAAK